MSRGRISRSAGPIGCSKISAVECAGSVETSRTLRPRRLAASANAAEQVVFPTPPLPPKKTTCCASRSSSVFSSMAGCRLANARSPCGGARGGTVRGGRGRPPADTASRDWASAVASMKQSSRKRSFSSPRLAPQLVLVAAVRGAVEELAEPLTEFVPAYNYRPKRSAYGECPALGRLAHRPTTTLNWNAQPPRSSSPSLPSSSPPDV